MQTLNPTGFDWGRIKSLFVNSIGKNKSESELSSIAKGIKISKFHQNYRSQGDIVSLANAIQRHRSRAVSSDDLIEMIPHHPGSQRPQLLQINHKSEEDVAAVTKALLESGLGRVTAICWATDDHEVIKLCTGDDSDEILQQVWDTKQKENKFEDTDFRTALELHSSASIKGGEKHAVLLYKFGSSHEKKLDSLLRDFEGLTSVNHLEKIQSVMRTVDCMSLLHVLSRKYTLLKIKMVLSFGTTSDCGPKAVRLSSPMLEVQVKLRIWRILYSKMI